LDHVNPVPSASRAGRFFATSGVSGRNPATGKFPGTMGEQCAQMFASMRTMLELAGASPEDVVKITVWLKDRSQGDSEVNKEWIAMFPDPRSRPARTMLANPRLDAPMLVQCDCFGVIGDA
jgi:enamine deaminase RidA (YjgF/YER057c/UK114 family)